jgi:transcriptional regulator with XRE-family HTH domain
MHKTGTSQSELSRLSGVHQPSISQFLSAKVELSDEQLERLLSCMGYRLEITRQPVIPDLTRSERRSWKLHRELAKHLTRSTLAQWQPTIERNLRRLRSSVSGQPHTRNLDRWESLVEHRDVSGLHRVLTGLGRESIEMREVSPMGGLLPDEERIRVLHTVR